MVETIKLAELAVARSARRPSTQEEEAANYRWLRDNPALACAVSGAIRKIFNLRTPGPGLDDAVEAARELEAAWQRGSP